MKGPGTLLILDEVQKVPGWSEQIKLLFDEDRGKRDLRVLLLGSSSLYMQRGIRESLAGRFELTRAPHWSFQEFKTEFSWDFNTYMRFGAYPAAVRFATDEPRWRNFILHSIVEPVLTKDILGQHPVNNPALFRQTLELAVQYPAQIISLQKLLGQLQNRGNAATIRHYLQLFEQCFLISMLQKYTGSIIQTRASSPKIVVMNPALTNAYQSHSKLDDDMKWYGHCFESIVGMHLHRIPECELFYWKEGDNEVDYIIKTPRETVAIEIKSGTRIRQSQGVVAFAKRYPKIRCETWGLDRCLRFMEDGVL